MYRTGAQVWGGLLKNATEGMASSAAILPWSLLLLVGQVAPAGLLAWALVARALGGRQPISIPILWACGAALAASYAVRAGGAARFGQSWLSVALHPVGIALLVTLQWQALIRKLRGKPAGWRGRDYPATATPAH